MRVFVTGATGFIGLPVVKELVAAGHRVIGLSRSQEKAAALQAAGAEVLHGTLEDAGSLRAGVERADGVIHLAFNHDFSRFVQNCEDDRRVIDALAAALAGSDRSLVVTSGTGIANTVAGQPAKEDHPTVGADTHPRAASEEAAHAAAKAHGANVSIVRLPQVHDTARQGLISPLIEMYRAKGACAYVGDGLNRWPAAHVLDVARLFRLAREGRAGREVPRGGRGRRGDARDRRGARAAAAVAGSLPRARGSTGLLRLARDVRGAGPAGVERVDARDPGMAADGANADRGPRSAADGLSDQAWRKPCKVWSSTTRVCPSTMPFHSSLSQ